MKIIWLLAGVFMASQLLAGIALWRSFRNAPDDRELWPNMSDEERWRML